jgi:hypothetical protein
VGTQVAPRWHVQRQAVLCCAVLRCALCSSAQAGSSGGRSEESTSDKSGAAAGAPVNTGEQHLPAATTRSCS